MPQTFQLPRRLELKLAKLADAREERDRINARIDTYEKELCNWGFNAVLGQAAHLGHLPAGPFILNSDDLKVNYVVHDTSTPAVNDDVCQLLDQAEISLATVARTRQSAVIAPEASDRPSAMAVAVKAAQEGVRSHGKVLGEHFTTAELDNLIEVSTGKHLQKGRLARRLPVLLDLMEEDKYDQIALELQALKVTQYLKIQA